MLWLLQASLFCCWQESVGSDLPVWRITAFVCPLFPWPSVKFSILWNPTHIWRFQLDPYVFFSWTPLERFPLFLSLQGIWRIPVDEIDRPGSFASHMNRSIVLLLNVLSQLKDYNTLLKVSSMLQRTPDQGKYGLFILIHHFVKLWIYFVHCVTTLFGLGKVFGQIPQEYTGMIVNFSQDYDSIVESRISLETQTGRRAALIDLQRLSVMWRDSLVEQRIMTSAPFCWPLA